jgi:hypothetical protein
MATARKPRTYRISDEAGEAVASAAEKTDLSQGHIIESCILQHIDTVIALAQKEDKQRREKLKEPRSIDALSRGHAQREFAPRGSAVAKEKPAEEKPTAGLNIKQSN